MLNRNISITIIFFVFITAFIHSTTKGNMWIDEVYNGSEFLDEYNGGGFSKTGVSILLVSDQTDGVDIPEFYDSYYINAVEGGDYSYGVWEHDILGSPNIDDIVDYDMIIWFTGISGEYSSDSSIYGHLTLSIAEESLLEKYLMETSGNKTLVLSGMWIAWNCVADAGNEEQLYSYLFSNLLGLDYIQDNFTNWIEVDDDWTISGESGSPFFSVDTYDLDWRSSKNFPDQIESNDNDETALWIDENDETHYHSMIYNEIQKSDGTARIVLMSCPLEAIENSNDRQQLIEEICEWSGIYPVSIQAMSLGSIKSLFSD